MKHLRMVAIGVTLACMWILQTHAQYYMYIPGTVYSFPAFDQYGGYTPCQAVQPSSSCPIAPFTDQTLCHFVPTGVSMTPIIDQTFIAGDPTQSGTIQVSCEMSKLTEPNTTMVLTTDGTLPDIAKATSQLLYYVPYNSTNPIPVIFARCISGNRVPSRIAYIQRIVWTATLNGTAWPAPEHCNQALHYKELDLPRCNTALYGKLCDGQTIITGAITTPTLKPATPTPHFDNSSNINTTVTPSSVATTTSLGAILRLCFITVVLWMGVYV